LETIQYTERGRGREEVISDQEGRGKVFGYQLSGGRGGGTVTRRREAQNAIRENGVPGKPKMAT
jgi:hypothetical protein